MTASADRLRFDNLVFLHETRRVRLSEAMYSGAIRLDLDAAEVASRIHPVKQRLFDRVLARERIEVTLTDPQGHTGVWTVDDQIDLVVSSPDGLVTLSYAEVAGEHRHTVTSEVVGRGFDLDAEPLLRRMSDGSSRLVFCSMPPARHRLGSGFDMDHFGQALLRNAGAEITWDDRDVFILPTANAARIRRMLEFIAEYPGA